MTRTSAPTAATSSGLRDPREVWSPGDRPGPVEREHQLTAEALAEQVLGHEGLQLDGELVVTAQLEVGCDPLLLGGEAQLLEARNLGLREVLVPELGKRRPPPERQCGAQLLGGLRGVAAGKGAASLLHACAVGLRVQTLGRDDEAVAVAVGLERTARRAEV